MTQRPPAISGSQPAQLSLRIDSAPDWSSTDSSEPGSLVVMVYMSAKPMSVELKQLVSLTSAILGSPGSANSISTHCAFHHVSLRVLGFSLGEK